jgi:hypothetical protein
MTWFNIDFSFLKGGFIVNDLLKICAKGDRECNMERRLPVDD